MVVWFAVAIILLSGLSGAGVWYYRHQRETLRRDVWSDLNAIADLKVSQISEWRRSRLAEARILSDVASRAISGDLPLPGDGQRGGLPQDLLTTFRDNTQAERIVVVSRDGQVLQAVPASVSQVAQTDRALVERCFTERKILFSDFNKDPGQEELAKHSDELQRLTAHLDIREEESRRISREIHEEFGNALAGARFSLLDLHGRIPDDHPELAQRINSILVEQKSLIDQVRRISQHLRPPILDQLGLIPAIKWLADDFELRTGTKCLVSAQAPDGAKRERPYASAIYRICQEALSNVARHAGSLGAQVLFSENETEVVLEVRDNGKGFNLSEGNASSIGIINMRERARHFGGTLDIITSPGQGTRVTVRIPVRAQADGMVLGKP